MTSVPDLIAGYRAVGCSASVAGTGLGTNIYVDDHGLAWAASVADLASRLTRLRGAGCSSAGALRRVVATRPVPPAVARREGYLLLGWDSDDRLTWQVSVLRDGRPYAWDEASAAEHDRAAVRRDALRRSLRLSVDYRVSGAAVVWFVPDAPALATSVLLEPTRVTAAGAALDARDVEIVVTPPGTVLTAPSRAAARLCDGLGRRHARLRPEDLPRISGALR